MTAATPYDLLMAAVAADRARPLVTYIDEGTGERTELSTATFENWVAKTANLLVDDLDAQPGTRVALLLPLHWQTAVWLAACWATGCVAAPEGNPAAADVVVAHTERLPEIDAALRSGRDVLSLSLLALARPGGHASAGVVDYDVEIRSYGDRFAANAPTPPTAPALALASGQVLDGSELVTAAEVAARRWGAPRRLVTAWAPDTVDGVLAALVVPLLTGGAAVLARGFDGADGARLHDLLDTEGAEALAGLTAPVGSSIRKLDATH